MSGATYWEGLLEEEIQEVGRLLDGIRLTKTAHVLSVVCQVERKLGSAFEIKKSYREELERTETKAKIRRHHANRLQELDQQLLARQINWDMMTQTETNALKNRLEKAEDDLSTADSTSTGWTAWTGWTASTPSVSSTKTSKSSGASSTKASRSTLTSSKKKSKSSGKSNRK